MYDLCAVESEMFRTDPAWCRAMILVGIEAAYHSFWGNVYWEENREHTRGTMRMVMEHVLGEHKGAVVVT